MSLESTTTEASLILGRRLLEVLTGPADRTAATTLAMIRLGMIPSTVRFLCGGIDLADVAQRAASTTLPVGKGIGSTAQAVHGELDRQARIAAGTLIDMSSLTDDEDEAPTRGRGVGGRRSLIQNMDALAAADRARNGESGAVGGDNEDDDEELDDAEMAERVRERRYISSLVLERLSQCDDAMRWLCVPRVLAHLLDVLRQNRLRVEEIYANEPEADTPPSENSEETILRISIQSACRTMSTLARNKVRAAGSGSTIVGQLHDLAVPTCLLMRGRWCARDQVLSRARRARVSVAVLSLGAIDDLLALLSPNVEAQVIRLSQVCCSYRYEQAASMDRVMKRPTWLMWHSTALCSSVWYNLWLTSCMFEYGVGCRKRMRKLICAMQNKQSSRPRWMLPCRPEQERTKNSDSP